ncbi:MAG: esterase-like activity of phytase family protein [Pseudomonadota bacterium]
MVADYPPTMIDTKLFLTAAAALLTAACTAPGAPSETAASEAALWRFTEAAPQLQAASCPEDQPFTRAEGFDITVEPLALGEADVVSLAGGYTLSGWVLASASDRFGGLSGMAVMASGTVLAVSDKGAFIWLTMEDGAPTGAAHYAKMQDEAGEPLGGKTRGDAEGLALADGVALVSFERDHRILAFDLEACGANALGVPVARVASRPAGLSRTMRENGGIEGLTLLADDTLAAVIETRDPSVPYGRLRDDGSLTVEAQIPTFEGKSGTGIEAVGDTLYTVHRDYRPGDGNHVTLSATPLLDGVPAGEPKPLLSLDPSGQSDNFEAVAAVLNAEGAVSRLYLLSDDNFSDRQRTLLFALDVNSP